MKTDNTVREMVRDLLLASFLIHYINEMYFPISSVVLLFPAIFHRDNRISVRLRLFNGTENSRFEPVLLGSAPPDG